MKKLYATLLVATAMAVFGPQGPASAAPVPQAADKQASEEVSTTGLPSKCFNQPVLNGWAVRCSKLNGGSYRAAVKCFPLVGGPPVYRWAPKWEKGAFSVVYCPTMTFRETGGVLKKTT